MDKELSEHTFKLNEQEALEQLKELFEFTTPTRLRKSLQKGMFSHLREQSDAGQEPSHKDLIIDFELLIEFLDRLNDFTT